VSRFGLVAFASSLDQVGPMARSVKDCALLLGAIAGPDPSDMTCARQRVDDYESALADGVSGLRIGVPREYFGSGVAAEVSSAVRAALETMQRLGACLEDISLPHTEAAVPTYYLVANAEASSNLARYDGVRYGLRQPGDGDLGGMYRATRHAGFGDEVKRRIMLGTFALSAGYYDAYYQKAMKVRRLIRQDFETAFASVDLIACPTAPETAFLLGERTQDPLAMYRSDIFTVTANLAGLPALSMPCGRSGENLPIGFQLLAPHFQETRLLAAAQALEDALGYDARTPEADS
jgi:aspartyl-tRNA(Asn)/glutamyl-tRNA(Gln) amidotransferase subunit A